VSAPVAPEPVVEPAARRIPDEGLGQEHPTVYPVRDPEPARRTRRAPVGRIALVLLLVAGALAALWALSRGRKPEPRVARATRTAAAPQRSDSVPPVAPARRENPNPVPQPGSGVLPTPAAVSPEAATEGPPGAATATPSTTPPGAPTGRPTSRPAPVASTPRPPAPVASVPVSVPGASGGAGAARRNREGEGLFERGDVAGAVARFRGAVAAAPGNAYYHNNLGWALFEAGELEGAGREIGEAIRLDPRRAIAYANLGEVRWARGDHAGAISAYERFLELNDDPRRERIARAKLTRMRGAG
jgi:hypothetical protein